MTADLTTWQRRTWPDKACAAGQAAGAGAQLEYSEYHHPGAHPPGADHCLGDHLERDGDRILGLPHRRRQRRRRRLSRQALQHGERTRRLARSARRQGAAGFDLCGAWHCRARAALDRHPRGLARHHDRQRLDGVMVVRQADPDEAASVSKLNTAAQIVLAALVLAEIGFGFNAAPLERSGMAWSPSLLCFRSLLSRRMGTAHEHVRGRTLDTPPELESASQAALVRASSRLRSITPRATHATIFWPGRATPRRLR